MSSYFFPERMEFVQILCPINSVYELMRSVCDFGMVQLLDMNKNNANGMKRYAETYLQCEDAERSLRYLEKELERNNMMPEAPALPLTGNRASGHLFDVFQSIKDLDEQVREKVKLATDLDSQLLRRIRKKECLYYFSNLIEKNVLQRDNMRSSLELAMLDESSMVQSIVAMVPIDKVQKIELAIYRVSRKNAMVFVGSSTSTRVPMVVFSSSESALARAKIICESFTEYVFEFSSDSLSIEQAKRDVEEDIEQMMTVSVTDVEICQGLLSTVSTNIWEWKAYIAREKLVWSSIDMGEYIDDNVLFTGWIPHRYYDGFSAMISGVDTPTAISLLHHSANARDQNVPTYISTNNFQYPFQVLNDSYGIPIYNELNAGAFYGMYPFLFGVMFGDVGHALFFLIATLLVFWFSSLLKTMKNELFSALYTFKWLLLFASVSALYCGFIYNECFGLPMNIFGTKYSLDTERSSFDISVWEKSTPDVYPLGIDPVWMFKDNELVFLNSYKMKLSIIMGMSQMFYGMFLQLINHLYRRDWESLITRFIPESMYLFPFFGYLVYVILRKWTIQHSPGDKSVDLIQMMIGMLLNFGEEDPEYELYPNQWTAQRTIVIIFITSVPLFLFMKPAVDIYKARGNKDTSILEIFVMNLIHVIEFCLSALSHTASYLRLWALSLAHSQLSHVLYEQILVSCIQSGNLILLTCGFALFAVLTTGILLGMEAFSALLHAIRLMWVEFSSKFYDGMGYAFSPVSTRTALHDIGIISNLSA